MIKKMNIGKVNLLQHGTFNSRKQVKPINCFHCANKCIFLQFEKIKKRKIDFFYQVKVKLVTG